MIERISYMCTLREIRFYMNYTPNKEVQASLVGKIDEGKIIKNVVCKTGL